MILKINCGNYEEELDLKEEIGKGAFGSVYLASDLRGMPFAVKMSNCINAATFYTAYQEIQILLDVIHINVARMYAFDFHNNKAVLVIEYCNGGNLNDRLNKPTTDEIKVQWMTQLLFAIQYLHKKKIVHRDLKPENVLLKNETLKLTDFGISRYYLQKGTNEEENSNLSEYIESFMGTFAGTPYWVAPEVFEHQYTEKADLFSLGILMYAILTKQSIVYDNKVYYGAFVPYNGKPVGIGLVMYEQNKHDLRPNFDNVDLHFSHNRNIKDVILQLLHYKPDKRLTTEKALSIIANLSVDENRKRKRNSDAVDFSTPPTSKRSHSEYKRSNKANNWAPYISHGNHQAQDVINMSHDDEGNEEDFEKLLPRHGASQNQSSLRDKLMSNISVVQTAVRSIFENFGDNKTTPRAPSDNIDCEKAIPVPPQESVPANSSNNREISTDAFGMIVLFIAILYGVALWIYIFFTDIIRKSYS